MPEKLALTHAAIELPRLLDTLTEQVATKSCLDFDYFQDQWISTGETGLSPLTDLLKNVEGHIRKLNRLAWAVVLAEVFRTHTGLLHPI